jgi:hypothetical protein
MAEFNLQFAEEYYTNCIKAKLREAISDMIVNKRASYEFIYIDFVKYDSVFMEIARDFNCDIDYIEQLHPLIEFKRYMLRIKPSSTLFNHVRTKKEVYRSEFDN